MRRIIGDEKLGMIPSSESGDKFRAIAESAADSIILVDQEGRIAYLNPASERLFGYTAWTRVARNWRSLFRRGITKDYRDALKAFKEKNNFRLSPLPLSQKESTKMAVEFPLEASASTTQIGGRWHLIAIVRDITDRRRAQESVGETLAIYRLMCDYQEDAIILVDVETQRFLEVNEAATKIYGYGREDFLKMRLVDVFVKWKRSRG